MTRDDIIRMAREAGVFTPDGHCATVTIEVAERFSALVAAAEREACLAEIEQGIWLDKTTSEILDSIAAAIRARGQA